ncbi:bifunctional 2-C-methyl-D-erythritol 4-phosphate cytidylyltransferase/2-C-methyl-D-erythritol 2,4-cyclodiphosphate synthase [Sphingobium sp. H33]|uniref:Bifunctional enzyme IspD/IspF n=2 Tax=Sphingobium nicotianae TaxID=2782607 RepID=A0A9X1AIU5_9SPHN|nr:bifunctional 2-C-methyl-D-erythritol 4-phosphate cytidylyltransferase/2-C-methyl-D-erythritol 2,4-cyclodiphosphate synthase [Sphingobium nicotianae]MBT2185579.1 bifunctional 2-C-methyl-D-erythritol 4-phosphate cytidylyltransferase/2-C-methyl-D-erythritol 2,4-cyclodiphosphate synthase [Sphingobium nicotianae]
MVSSLAAIVLAAGRGSRSGAGSPKQFRLLGGQPVLAHSIEAMRRHDRIDRVVLVVPPGGIDEARTLLGADAKGLTIVEGGETRRLSVRNALEALAAGDSTPSHVLVHDSARPGLPSSVINRLIAALEAGAAGTMPVLPVADTLITDQDGLSGDTVDRAPLRRVQTPQAFDFPAILTAHRDWSAPDEPTDDAQMLRALGHDIALVEGDPRLDKITYPGDHERMERQLGAAMSVRVGLGFDVHRLVAGEDLWLGGVQIPHSHGLFGHSDADVAIHALVDALLGALAEGDIGSHFPPSDPQWRGARSAQFLAFAVERVRARGGRIDHADLTIICEAPKIGPHRDAMRARLAELMGLPEDRVSVKATTTERLGLTGRGEGIAAQAVATISLPERK